MSSELLQPSFTTGEISPALYARVDLQRFQSALKTCRNFIVRPYGGVQNRPGTKYIVEVKNSAKRARLIPFQFSDQQTYVLEFGDGYVRFITNGGQLVVSGVAAWSNATAYEVGDLVVQGGVNYYCILEHTNQVPPNATYWYALTGSIYEVPTEYAEADLADLHFTQSGDVLTLVHPDYKPSELRRNGATDWTLKYVVSTGGPFQDLNTDDTVTIRCTVLEDSGQLIATGGNVFTSAMVGSTVRLEMPADDPTLRWEAGKSITVGDIRKAGANYYEALNTATSGGVTPTHLKGSSYDGNASVNWKYLHSGFGLARITAYTSATTVSCTVLSRMPNPITSTSGISNTWTITPSGLAAYNIAGATSALSTDYKVTFKKTIYGRGGSTTYTVISPNDYVVDAVADTITFDYTVSQPASGTGVLTIIVQQVAAAGVGTSLWALEEWSDTRGYPAAVAYQDGRLTFGGSTTEPQTMWLSQVENYKNFSQSNPIVDDDAITATLSARKAQAILDLVPLDKLVVLTSGGEWKVIGGQDDVITPDTIGFKVQSERGSNGLQAKVIGSTALYVQERGQVVRDLSYSFESDGYNGNDLSVLAEHLFRNKAVVDMDFHQIPFSVLWCVMDDGGLLGLTYVREQDVIGWSRHDTDGTFENVCTVAEGDEDGTYFVVNRTIGGSTKRYIERMQSRIFADIVGAFFVDCGLSYDGRNTAATTMTLTGGTAWNQNETLTLTASVSTFAAGDVGDDIILTGADGAVIVRLRISAYTSGTVVSVIPDRTVPVGSRSAATTAWSFARDTMSGLSHLNGESVVVLADGHVEGPYTVAAGAITLQQPAAVVHAGLAYTSDFETLEVMSAGQQNVRTLPKQIPRVSLVVDESRGIFVGPDEDNLAELRAREFEDYDDPPSLRTGLVQVACYSKWGAGGIVFIRQSDPLPLTILACIPEVEVGGR